VDVVGNIDEIMEALGEFHYTTHTRGERVQSRARMMATGVYSIFALQKSKNTQATYLAYVLELPETAKELHKKFNILTESCFVINVKNPEQPSKKFAGLHKKAEYPKEFQELFKSRKFNPANPPQLLDYNGTELIIIGAREVKENSPQIALEKLAEEERKELSEDVIYDTLHLYKQHLPINPIRGNWE